jgi:hypothetical protein
MSSFFNSLSSEQQIIFVNELSKIWVSTDDIDISWARCNTMSYKWNDWNIVSGSILSIVWKNGRIEFPDLQSCWKPGSMNVNQYFQMLSELNHFTIPLEKWEAQDILNKLKNTSAKEFLETGDENLFNQVYTHFNKSELIKNGITEMILSKIIELYGKNPDFYDIFNPPNTISITTRIDDKTGRKEFFLKNIKNGGGFYFWP